MESGGFGPAWGFWIFLAAIIVVSTWAKSRRESEKHQTLRQIVERTGTLDEARMKELFKTDPVEQSKPGSGYRALRVSGTIIMFIGIGLLTFFLGFAALALIFGDTGTMAPRDRAGMLAAFASCAGITMFGYGLFYSSRFAEPPPTDRNEPPHAK